MLSNLARFCVRHIALVLGTGLLTLTGVLAATGPQPSILNTASTGEVLVIEESSGVQRFPLEIMDDEGEGSFSVADAATHPIFAGKGLIFQDVGVTDAASSLDYLEAYDGAGFDEGFIRPGDDNPEGDTYEDGEDPGASDNPFALEDLEACISAASTVFETRELLDLKLPSSTLLGEFSKTDAALAFATAVHDFESKGCPREIIQRALDGQDVVLWNNFGPSDASLALESLTAERQAIFDIGIRVHPATNSSNTSGNLATIEPAIGSRAITRESISGLDFQIPPHRPRARLGS